MITYKTSLLKTMYILLAIHENLSFENSLFMLHLNVTDAEF